VFFLFERLIVAAMMWTTTRWNTHHSAPPIAPIENVQQ